MSKIQVPTETLDRMKLVVNYMYSIIYSDAGLIEDPGGFRLAQIYAMELRDLFESTGIHVSAKDIEDAGKE